MNRRYRGLEFYLLSFLLIFFAVPYLFDVAYCEELYGGTPPSQAALIDGEKVEPYDGHGFFPSLDCAIGRNVGVIHLPQSSLLLRSLEPCSPRGQVPLLLISRPPPAV